MTATTVIVERETPHSQAMARRASGTTFSWIMVGLSAWLVVGLYLDGWVHSHRYLDVSLFGPTDPTRAYSPPGLPFGLTVWHVPYFGGLSVMAIYLAVILLRKRFAGPGRVSLSPGHSGALLGITMVVAGIAGEGIWPTTYAVPGFSGLGSAALAGLLGPFRLLQAVGLAFIISTPLRLAWSPGEGMPSWRAQAPVVLALGLLLSLLSYVTLFAHPLVDPWPALTYWRRYLVEYRYGQFVLGESLGALSIILQTGLLMGLILVAVRRWRLPLGGMTVIFTLNAVLMASLQDYYFLVVPAVLGGVIADILLRRMAAPPLRVLEFRLFAFAVPVVYYAAYFLTVAQSRAIEPSWGAVARNPALRLPPIEGLGWTLQLVVGSILTAGLVGWLVSLLILPPGEGRTVRAG